MTAPASRSDRIRLWWPSARRRCRAVQSNTSGLEARVTGSPLSPRRAVNGAIRPKGPPRSVKQFDSAGKPRGATRHRPTAPEAFRTRIVWDCWDRPAGNRPIVAEAVDRRWGSRYDRSRERCPRNLGRGDENRDPQPSRHAVSGSSGVGPATYDAPVAKRSRRIAAQLSGPPRARRSVGFQAALAGTLIVLGLLWTSVSKIHH